MLNVLLVRPSRYDDDGYVVHHALGVLPSNTLYTLNGLFRAAAEKMGLDVRMRLIDEAVELVVPEKLMRRLGQLGDAQTRTTQVTRYDLGQSTPTSAPGEPAYFCEEV